MSFHGLLVTDIFPILFYNKMFYSAYFEDTQLVFIVKTKFNTEIHI
jgi:hypothetical protein